MKFRNILFTSVVVLFCAASLSAATIEHTWVSRSGSNSNACTVNSPCATFAYALTKTTAGGMITAEDAGDFGSVTINQSVTIDGNNSGSITFNSTGVGTGITITGGANVTVQNLTINGLGSGGAGINADGAGIVTVDNCKIMNFQGQGILFGGIGNLVVKNSEIEAITGKFGAGIFINGDGAENVVVKNTVIDASPISNSNVGFNVDNVSGGPVKAALQNVTIMGAGFGAVQAATGTTQITSSVLTQSVTGVYAAGNTTISVASSLITDNTTGVCSGTGAKIRLDNNDIYDNTTAIGNCGGIVKTSTTNKTSGTIAIPAADVSESVTF